MENSGATEVLHAMGLRRTDAAMEEDSLRGVQAQLQRQGTCNDLRKPLHLSAFDSMMVERMELVRNHRFWERFLAVLVWDVSPCLDCSLLQYLQQAYAHRRFDHQIIETSPD